MLWDASLGVQIGDRIESAVILTVFREEPLFAFCLTRPGHRRRGFCRSLMIEALHALRQAGRPRAHLYVTRANDPAVNLYAQLGFASLPEDAEGR